jgi:hypothetical protein
MLPTEVKAGSQMKSMMVVAVFDPVLYVNTSRKPLL